MNAINKAQIQIRGQMPILQKAKVSSDVYQDGKDVHSPFSEVMHVIKQC